MANFGMPTEPIIHFFSGDFAVIKRIKPIMKEGRPHYQIFMALSDEILQRYDLKESKFNIPNIFVKSYPTSYVYMLSPDPTNPNYLCLCNFDGTKSIEMEIQRVVEQNAQIKNSLNTALLENEAIEIRMKQLIETINELREEQKE